MSLRTMAIVFLALICGGASAIGIHLATRPPPPVTVSSPQETYQIVVPGVRIPFGSRIDKEKLTTIALVKPADGQRPPADLVTRAEDLIGKYSRVDLLPQQSIFKSHVSEEPPSILKVQDGMRAITIEMKTIAAAVNGFVRPGERVDVLGFDPSGADRLLKQNLKILAVEKDLTPAGTGKNEVAKEMVRSVTLEVNPADMQEIFRYQTKGTLQLVLRGAGQDIAPVGGPVAKAAAPDWDYVEVRGGAVQRGRRIQ